MKESGNVNPTNHPNLEFEDDIKALQNIIEIGNSSDDFENLNYLNKNLFSKKFDNNDIWLINELKKKYLIKVNI